MYVPNVFTPNEDGINDNFRPYLKFEPYTEVELFQVFDRWGNLVHEATDFEMAWDGKFQGKYVNPAVFTWHIRTNFTGCKDPVTIYEYGDVTVVR